MHNIKEKIKTIYIIGGTSCVGKTTMAKTLSNKLDRSIYIKFFYEIELLSLSKGFCKSQKLHYWYDLIREYSDSTFKYYIEIYDNIIIDIHFSLYNMEEAEIAFAKRKYVGCQKATPTLGKDFFLNQYSSSIMWKIILLYNSADEIIRRLKVNGCYSSNKKSIINDINNEEENCLFLLNELIFARKLVEFKKVETSETTEILLKHVL